MSLIASVCKCLSGSRSKKYQIQWLELSPAQLAAYMVATTAYATLTMYATLSMYYILRRHTVRQSVFCRFQCKLLICIRNMIASKSKHSLNFQQNIASLLCNFKESRLKLKLCLINEILRNVKAPIWWLTVQRLAIIIGILISIHCGLLLQVTKRLNRLAF